MTIAYLRVSTGKQHLENQKEEIEKFAARKNLTINRWDYGGCKWQKERA